jgi:hypothetical protein
MEVPRFEVGCTSCRFIGRDGDFDLYVCETHIDLSFIARYGPGTKFYSFTVSKIPGDVENDKQPLNALSSLIEAYLRGRHIRLPMTEHQKQLFPALAKRLEKEGHLRRAYVPKAKE